MSSPWPLASLVLMVSFLPPPLAAEDEIEFSRDVRPIFASHCFGCHGFDAMHHNADLQLDALRGQ